ncbi:hypothetical protein [Blastococcus brunescens]|uniref:Uncharacterized protein n=1 Tax=Blastococcus brunescens TaxID=1564165 RepID=A0ABZ1AXR8_9ACTN|nr:hypothetical protein [Blastococcus sp. BMG 8361]WRL62296.1 hypothetical protein U6N30_19950 [Blastococcus sp. BMG 8361]
MEDAGPGVSAVPPAAPPSRSSGLRRPAVAYALIAVLVVAPIYVMAASLAVRAGLFDFSADAELSADDARAAWGFVGAAVAAAVTATGLLLTRSHNIRTLAFQESVEQAKRETERQADQRLSLDTVIAGLKLLGEGPQYSTPAAVAGGSPRSCSWGTRSSRSVASLRPGRTARPSTSRPPSGSWRRPSRRATTSRSTRC